MIVSHPISFLTVWRVLPLPTSLHTFHVRSSGSYLNSKLFSYYVLIMIFPPYYKVSFQMFLSTTIISYGVWKSLVIIFVVPQALLVCMLVMQHIS